MIRVYFGNRVVRAGTHAPPSAERAENMKRANHMITLIGLLLFFTSRGAWGSGSQHIRVVPQFAWEKEGRVSPDGKFAACISKYKRASVRVVDVANRCLGWHISLPEARDIAFSSDGRYLAGCGKNCGFILDLTTGKTSCVETLQGSLLAFSPNSQTLFLLRYNSDSGRAASLHILDLAGVANKKYVLSMSCPELIEFSPDGSSVTVYGMDGNRAMHVPRMSKVVQVIDLQTWDAHIEKSAPVRGCPRSRRVAKHDSIIPCDMRATSGQNFQGLFWDEATGILVVHGAGSPEGGVLKAWSLRDGRFLGTVGTRNEVNDVGGFLRPGILVANAWNEGKKTLTLLNLQGKQRTHTQIEGKRFVPSPDQRHVAVVSDKLRIWDLVSKQKVLETEGPSKHALYRWSPKGNFFVRVGWKRDDSSFVEICYRDGRLARVSAPDVKQAKPMPTITEAQYKLAGTMGTSQEAYEKMKQREYASKVRSRCMIWSTAVSPDSSKLALGVGNLEQGRAVVWDITGEQVLAELGGFTEWVQDVLFFQEGLVLCGSLEGKIRLWNYSANEVVWETDMRREFICFGHVPGSRYVVCQHQDRAGTVLDLQHKWVIRHTKPLKSSSHRRTSWTNPMLVDGGRVLVEGEPNTIQVHVTRTHEPGRSITFCPLPNDQWIIYLPTGAWMGSDQVHAWVRFYDAGRLLSVEAAEKYRNPEATKAQIAAVFAGDNR